ncbi:MAG: flavodoxin family protein [Candidatus Hodarchaeota archaeon]
MKILIVFYSSSGHTKKVVDLIEERLSNNGHEVTVRNALTTQAEMVDEAELLLIGTPVHGYILFGQKPAREVKEFLKDELPEDLHAKSVIAFATYLFFPAGALNTVKKTIETRNGRIIGAFARRRTNKADLADSILDCIEKSFS